MQGKAGLVMFVGGGLVIANAWSNGTIQDLASGQIQNSTVPNHKWYQTPWGTIGYEALGVLVGTVIANASDDGGSVVLVFFVVLWLLWLMNTLGKGSSSSGSIAKTVTSSANDYAIATSTSGQVSGASNNPSTPSGNAYTLPNQNVVPPGGYSIPGQAYTPGNPHHLSYTTLPGA